MSAQTYTILVVDDDPVICSLLDEMLHKRGYAVSTAANGMLALEQLSRRHFDMVISDIQMPVMDGFALFSQLEEKFPRVKRVLMTGGDIDEYLSLIRGHNIGNILSKGGDFHLDEITDYIGSLLNGDIFGLPRYLPRGALQHRIIRSAQQAQSVCSEILNEYNSDDKVFLEIAINELISNAVFHAILQMSNVSRESWNDAYLLDEKKSIRVNWANDNEKIGVSIEDPIGTLKKVDVLRWLDHGIDEQMTEGEHGRGFLIIRRLIDRFIINIDPGKRTECILIHYFGSNLTHTRKPLLIHEI